MNNPNIEETLPNPVGESAGDLQETTPTHNPGARGSFDDQQAPASEPAGVGDEPPDADANPRRRRVPSWLLLSIVGLFTLLLIGGMSAYGGYRSGMYERRTLATAQQGTQLRVQYDLAVQDLQEGRFELARQRLEWVGQQDANYPGVVDLLAELYLVFNTTATPTIAPTPTLTPTPDLRSIEELYTMGQMAMAANEWDNAIETLLKLRKKAPDYHAVDLDGMLYVALRNRGLEKIKSGELESGTYDLALAERFGPLDSEAKSHRTWAELYISGASFWEVDWARSVTYFSELSVVAPYLMDTTGWTSIERYRRSLIGYGDWLARQERWCDAQEQYAKAFEISDSPDVQPTATYVADECSGAGEAEEGDDLQPLETVIPPVEITPLPPEATQPSPVVPDPTEAVPDNPDPDPYP